MFCVKKVQETRPTLIPMLKSIIFHFGKNLGCKMWLEICQKCPLNSRKCVGVCGFPRPLWGTYSAPQLEGDGCSTSSLKPHPQWSPPYTKILATPMCESLK